MSRITQPALSIVGQGSQERSPIWTERHELILAWVPKAEAFVLPDATHLLHVQHPRAVAEAWPPSSRGTRSECGERARASRSVP